MSDLTALLQTLGEASLAGQLVWRRCSTTYAGCGEWLGHEANAPSIVCPLCKVTQLVRCLRLKRSPS